MQDYFLFQSEHVVLIYSWNVHTYSLTYVGANLTIREVASSANSYANCHYDICQSTFSS